MTQPGNGASSMSTVDRMVHAAVERLHESRNITVNLADIAAFAGVELDAAKALFPDDDALDEAIGSFGIMKLSDAMNRALIAAPRGDNRAALIALANAYIDWARDNRSLYYVLTTRLMQPRRVNSIVRKYDAGFVLLVRRFFGDDDVAPTRRAAIARAFLYGFTDLVLEDHLELWMLPNDDPAAEVRATVEEFVDILLNKRDAGAPS